MTVMRARKIVPPIAPPAITPVLLLLLEELCVGFEDCWVTDCWVADCWVTVEVVCPAELVEITLMEESDATDWVDVIDCND